MSNTVNPFNDDTINVPTSGKTDRGTKIRRVTDNTMDKDAFLKILAAQLSHLDPSKDQDSTAYVSQMAQFTAMEQMQNLNATMSNSSYQQMVGKTVITNKTDEYGSYIQGYVTEAIKKSGGTYLSLMINGKKEEFSAENIIGTVQADDTNTNANSKSAINSDFLAASALAADKKSAVLGELDKDGKITFVKGKITGAYIDAIDAINGAKVKIKVDILNADGTTSTNKIYNYEDIIKAGDLTPDEMNTAIKEAEESIAKLVAADKAEADEAAAGTATGA